MSRMMSSRKNLNSTGESSSFLMTNNININSCKSLRKLTDLISDDENDEVCIHKKLNP